MEQSVDRSIEAARAFARQCNPFLRRVRRLVRPARFGTLRRTRPLSNQWGYDRGTPLDRHYIELFLAEYASDVRGRVLEIKDSSYTVRYGHDIEQCDVLDIDPKNTYATIVADLTDAANIDSNKFDCFICTQTLHCIYDVRAALVQAHRILRPGGVLLATLPAVSRIIHEYDNLSDYWRFTPASCERLFAEIFGPEQFMLRSYGNVLTEIAFLMGLSTEELRPHELRAHDASFPLIIGVRAVKVQGQSEGDR